MATEAKSQDSENVPCRDKLETIVAELQHVTTLVSSIKSEFNEMEQEVEYDRMDHDDWMIERARLISELQNYKDMLTKAQEQKQRSCGSNCLVHDQKNEIRVLYSTLKQYHIAIKEGLESAFKHRLQEQNAAKFKKLMEKSVDAAAHEVIMRLCANPELSSNKAVCCAKFFRENACEALPLPLIESDNELLNDIMNSADNE